jgi:hypothetical protein
MLKLEFQNVPNGNRTQLKCLVCKPVVKLLTISTLSDFLVPISLRNKIIFVNFRLPFG